MEDAFTLEVQEMIQGLASLLYIIEDKIFRSD